jgi:hypothetical protein
MDASAGQLWPREPVGEARYPGNYAGQRRWIERAGRVLGLSETVPKRKGEAIAEDLGIPGLEQGQARRQFLDAPGLRERGQAVSMLLSELRLDGHLFARFLAAGFRTGCLGRPWLFDPSLKRRISPLSPVGRALRRPP